MQHNLKLADIDIYNPDAYVDHTPHELFRHLREHEPVFWQRYDGGGYWVATRHADVVKVSREHGNYSAQEGFVLIEDLAPEILEQSQHQLLGMDPPDHGPNRRMVITHFTGRMLQNLETRIHTITNEIFDRLMDKKAACDFVEDAAALLPAQVIAEMMGVPRKDWAQFRLWADKLTSGDDPEITTPEESLKASAEMGMYGYELASGLKSSTATDLCSLLMTADFEGRKATPEEVASLFIQISVAGNETTRSLIAGGMLTLIQHPEVMAELVANPSLIPGAVEEMLRYVCPLHYFRRTATCDNELGGKKIRKGDKVVMLYASANRDELVFSEPDTFNIHRDPNPHLSFGHGIHLCLGANLARMEARIFFEEYCKRFKLPELKGEVRRLRSNLVNGIKTMPVAIATV